MTSPGRVEPYDPEAVVDYRRQAHLSLDRAREYLAADDLHQAAEKGWGAAAWMARAVAVTHGWQYENHAQFGVVLRNANALRQNDRLRLLGEVAYGLHRSYDTRKVFLDAETIGQSLDEIAELLYTLEPLITPGNE